MSKNLTRKGLAFGALVALGSSVIAGAPANAAPTSLTIASSYGTSLNSIIGAPFDVAVSGVGVAGANDEYKLFVEGAVAADFGTLAYRTGTDLTVTKASGPYNGTANVSTVSSTDKTSVINNITSVGANYTQLRLLLSTSAVTATRTIKVTPFVDNVVADGKITSGEVAGAPISVTFYKSSEVTATAKISAPVLAATSLSATVTLDKDINLEQFRTGDSPVRVKFKDNGDDAATTPTAEAIWSKSSAALKADLSSGVAGVSSSHVYSAQAQISNGTSFLDSGVVSTATPTDGTVDVNNVSVTAADVVGSTAGANVRYDAANSYGVRKATTTLSVSTGEINKLDADSTGLVSVGAGVPARVTITAANLASTSTFAAGGKTLSKTNDSATFETTTNADGKVAFDVTATGAAGDKLTVDVKVLDKTSYLDAVDTTYLWESATVATTPVAVNQIGSLSTTKEVQVKTGGSYTLNWQLTDNYGALYTGTERRVAVSINGAVNGSIAAAISTNVTFVGGKASLTVTDSNSNAGSYTVRAQLQSYTASTDTWASTNLNYVDSVVNVVKNTTVGFVTKSESADSDKYSSSTKAAIAYATLASADYRLDSNSGTFAGAALGSSYAIVKGKVLNTDGVALPGSPVTITGTGILFAASSDSVVSLGSITVLTDANGDYVVNAYSNKAGKQEIKATSGSIVATYTREWDVAPAAKASVITITAPASAAPGTTVAVVVTLTDKYGNVVDTTAGTGPSFSVRVSGPGSTSAFTDETNADGQLKFTQVLGSNETGSFKVTVKYDADAATQTKAVIVKEAVVTIAAAAAPVVVEPTSKIGTANGRVYVNVKDGKGSVVTVKIGSKWSTKTALNNDYTFSYKNKKGKKVSVKVYVDGDLSSSKTITVK